MVYTAFCQMEVGDSNKDSTFQASQYDGDYEGSTYSGSSISDSTQYCKVPLYPRPLSQDHFLSHWTPPSSCFVHAGQQWPLHMSNDHMSNDTFLLKSQNYPDCETPDSGYTGSPPDQIPYLAAEQYPPVRELDSPEPVPFSEDAATGQHPLFRAMTPSSDTVGDEIAVPNLFPPHGPACEDADILDEINCKGDRDTEDDSQDSDYHPRNERRSKSQVIKKPVREAQKSNKRSRAPGDTGSPKRAKRQTPGNTDSNAATRQRIARTANFPNSKDRRAPKSLPIASISKGRTDAKGSTKRKTGNLPCVFKFAGCKATFGAKNEWKRHAVSQHIVVEYWVCGEEECFQQHPETKGMVFNRKDLFTQHVRRMHMGEGESPSHESLIKQKQARALKVRCQLPSQLRCRVQDCKEVFVGKRAWDDRMEHLARHYEKTTCGLEPEVPWIAASDEDLVQWASSPQIDVIRPGTSQQWVLHQPVETTANATKAKKRADNLMGIQMESS